jgi:hypothetical protein
MTWWQISLIIATGYVVLLGLLLALFDGSNIPTPTPPVEEDIWTFLERTVAQ